MSLFPLKPTSKYVKAYYAALKQFREHGHTTEGNTRSAFADPLKRCASLTAGAASSSTKGKQLRRAVDPLTPSMASEAKNSADDIQHI